MISRDSQYFLLLNVGHFLDHYFMLIFATVAALALSAGWGMSYSELLPYGAPGFTAFALCSLPMGILADRCDHTSNGRQWNAWPLALWAVSMSLGGRSPVHRP